MAAKVKVIKTLNEFNHLTSPATLGDKTGVVVFFDGGNAAAWKSHLSELNDLAGDFFEEASFIGVDARFFKQIIEKFPGSGEGKAAIFQKEDFAGCKVVSHDVASIREAVKK